jgi:renalase
MRDVEVLVIGAGMAGLLAARDLMVAGRSVRVVDKGRGVGGRVATRRVGSATFDHGAQFLTGREPRFDVLLAEWREAGLLMPWGMAPGSEGVVRWRGKPAMTAVAKALAIGLDVVTGTRVTGLRADGDEWLVDCDPGPVVRCGAIVLTAPVPQALELLSASAIALGDAQAELEQLTYDPCLVAMALLDGPSRVPAPGYVVPGAGPVAWIADNQQKGVSVEPAMTIHATIEFSRAHWDAPREASAQHLLEAAGDWLGAPVREVQAHGWRYARPVRTANQPFAFVSRSPPLLLAGDAFGGPDVEGAARSGWSAAAALLERVTGFSPPP